MFLPFPITSTAAPGSWFELKPAKIDGYTQAGATPITLGPGQGSNAKLQIELAINATGGFALFGGGSTVQGLAVNGKGIMLRNFGGNTIAGTWTAANGQLCLSTGGANECWPYASPFQAGQPVSLTSSCNSTSTWLASATNAPPPPPGQRGERGK